MANPRPKEFEDLLSFLNRSNSDEESRVVGAPEFETLKKRLVVETVMFPPLTLCLIALLIRLDITMSKRRGLASMVTSIAVFITSSNSLFSMKSSKISNCFSMLLFTWIVSFSVNWLFSILESRRSVLFNLDSL